MSEAIARELLRRMLSIWDDPMDDPSFVTRKDVLWDDVEHYLATPESPSDMVTMPRSLRISARISASGTKVVKVFSGDELIRQFDGLIGTDKDALYTVLLRVRKEKASG